MVAFAEQHRRRRLRGRDPAGRRPPQPASRERRGCAVRVGLNVGEPIREEDDYFGTPVVVAKRLCDVADGGQILASDLVRGC